MRAKILANYKGYKFGKNAFSSESGDVFRAAFPFFPVGKLTND
jgi:hypothetical protein